MSSLPPGTVNIMERLFGGMTNRKRDKFKSFVTTHTLPFWNSTMNKTVNELSLWACTALLIEVQNFQVRIFWTSPPLKTENKTVLLTSFKDTRKPTHISQKPHFPGFVCCLFVLAMKLKKRWTLVYWRDWIIAVTQLWHHKCEYDGHMTSYSDKSAQISTPRFNHNVTFILEEIHWTPAVSLWKPRSKTPMPAEF